MKKLWKLLFLSAISFCAVGTASAGDEFNFQSTNKLKTFHRKYDILSEANGSPVPYCAYSKNNQTIFADYAFFKRGKDWKNPKNGFRAILANLNGDSLLLKSEQYDTYEDRRGNIRVKERWNSDTYTVTLDRPYSVDNGKVTLNVYSKQTGNTKRLPVIANCFRW